MKKKIALFLIICLTCLCFTGCGYQKRNDTVEIYNKDFATFDNICIEVKDGYFYNSHEKFTVDENKIGLTIYFSKEDGSDDSWD